MTHHTSSTNDTPKKSKSSASSGKEPKATLNERRLKTRRTIEDILEEKREKVLYGELDALD